ncbi:aminoglycoside phosphotransferase family protein [Rhizobium leguminosarum]|uniref:aminoglycoside phosphotransferase family protein n=1 Tax=Rhizobium leguminosarum TaxID=384 RepID=UPI001C94939C|nr:aminoglycoside phosphotransferase family protein [Rhizobium leguminosarum]MBY5551718.1 aminoglycoside phosphotransferase family protein [Rhizobium leguminosarum]MBY5646517.1 aminoglycoside phosphotransferase family protein [Rhizobium leguminosarum]
MGEPEIPLIGGKDSNVVRIGETVRRGGRAWSPAVLDLLRHVERQGFDGSPRALGLDDQGREVLTYIEGEVGNGEGFLPDKGGRFDLRLPDYVWRDSVLERLGQLLRSYHDAAASFLWRDREWRLEARHPVETVCHNDLTPWNTVFQAGLPVAFIDWDAAAPGPRAWDLGFVAWRWVPFWRDEKCEAHGLQTGVREKARRFQLLLDAYGIEPEIGIMQAGIERVRQMQQHMRNLAAAGSAWETELASRGVLDEGMLEVAWMEEHAMDLIQRPGG